MRTRLHKDFYKALKWPRKENKIYYIPATPGMCKRREEEKRRKTKKKKKKTGRNSGKMKGVVQLKWRENMSVKDEMNNGEKREEKGNWCHHEHWGRKKGENGQPALDAKSQIRRELLYSFYQFSIFNFNLVFFCSCVFSLLLILLWILWINARFISVVSYPFPAESTLNEYFQNIAWELRTSWEERGITWWD